MNYFDRENVFENVEDAAAFEAISASSFSSYFDINCMLDFEGEQMSIYVADAARVTPLNLHVTLAELMLLETL